MTESDFWNYLHSERDRDITRIRSDGITSGNDPAPADIDYMIGHSLLPANYGNIPRKEVIGMGKLLLQKGVKSKTKEAIMILLAHKPTTDALFFLSEYAKAPDKGLKKFASLALEECLMWNG